MTGAEADPAGGHRIKRIWKAFGPVGQASLIGLATGLTVEVLSRTSPWGWIPGSFGVWQHTIPGTVAHLAPILLAIAAFSSLANRFRPAWVDFFYLATTLFALGSFFWINRGFIPVYPAFTVTTVLCFYLLVRLAWPLLHNRIALWTAFLVGCVGAEAVHALSQWWQDEQMRGHFYNKNYLAMLCALLVPLSIVQVCLPSQSRLSRAVGAVFVLIFVSIIPLSECRTAIVAVGVAVPCLLLALFWETRPVRWLRRLVALRPVTVVVGLSGIALAAAAFLYQMKPISASGRIFLWRIAVSIFGDHPVWGVGFGRLPHYMGIYHGKYFEGGNATPAETFLPSILESAFNQYLEVAVEFGLVGLVIWIPLWLLILQHTWNGLSQAPAAVHRAGGEQDGTSRDLPFVRAGYAATVLVFLLLSTLYDPERALVMTLIFTFCLAAMVSQEGDSFEDAG